MHIIALYGIGFVKLFAKIANFELQLYLGIVDTRNSGQTD